VPGDRGVAAIAEHAHGAWRQRARRRRLGPVAAAVDGAASSVPHAEDSSSPRETEVPRGWQQRCTGVGGGATDWGDWTTTRRHEAATHEHGVEETSFHRDFNFFI
jgi:hypothetical protein